jgi:hypothetical protein
MPNQISSFEGSFGLTVHSAQPPSDSEWGEWMVGCRAIKASELRVLVFTDGGGPNTLQRATFTEYHRSEQPRIAVISTALHVRGIVTALSWFNKQIRLFSPAEARTALDFLGIGPDEANRHLVRAHEMGERLNGGVPKSLKALGSL